MDDMVTSLHDRAKVVIEKWYEKHDPKTVRLRIDFNMMREITLIEIFSGRAGFPPDVLEGLKKRLPPDVVKRIEEGVERIKKEETIQRMPVKPEERYDYMPERYKEYSVP